MFYRITLLDNHVDNSFADIIVTPTGSMNVLSENQALKNSLERIISTVAFVVQPLRDINGYYSDTVQQLIPFTKEYAECLPQILAFRGYFTIKHQERHKSLDLFEDILSLKSMDGTYTNSKGEIIVKYVPQGYVAINRRDGRVVAGGRWLNANISKEGADWYLVDNQQYENAHPELRNAFMTMMHHGKGDYHVGAENELYNYRNEENDDSPYFQLPREMDISEGKELRHHYKDSTLTQTKPSLPNIDAKFPTTLADGLIVYSPTAGMAFKSEHYPPDMPDFNDHDWYFTEDTIGDKDMREFFRQTSTSFNPMLLDGIDDGIVHIDLENNKHKFSDGLPIPPNYSRLQLLNSSADSFSYDNVSVEINETVLPNYDRNTLNTPEYINKLKEIRSVLMPIKKKTNYKGETANNDLIDPELENVEIEHLRGKYANISYGYEPFNYQKPIIQFLTNLLNYDKWGGLAGNHGVFLNLDYGTGKTFVTIAADTIMRNLGHFKVGKQFTLITQPSKNIDVWRDEIEKFRNESAFVISGTPEKRKEQWEKLVKKAQEGELPNFVLLTNSKLEYERNQKEIPVSEKELSIDSKYIRLLSLGGSINGSEVKGEHISALALDESGNFMNNTSARHSSLNKILDALYQGGAVTWTLSGDISSNSAGDAISQVGFINYIVRKENDKFRATYLSSTDSGRNSRMKWRNTQHEMTFFNSLGTSIYSLKGKHIAGDKYGKRYTEPMHTPLGSNWGRVYIQSLSKMNNLMAHRQQTERSPLGLFSTVINSSFGAVHPARLLDYDLGMDAIKEGVNHFILNQNERDEFFEEIKDYQRIYTSTVLPNVRMPNPVPKEGEHSNIPNEYMGVSSIERNKAYETYISSKNRAVLEQILDSWDNPLSDGVVNCFIDELNNARGKKGNIKLGFSGFSSSFVKNVYKKLNRRIDSSNTIINYIGGDVSSEEVSRIQSVHQNETDKNVITLVTKAGAEGLSLPASRALAMTAWSPRVRDQLTARSHRHPEQNCLVTTVIPSGLANYMEKLCSDKEAQANQSMDMVTGNASEEGYEFNSVETLRSFLQVQRKYRPEILPRESKDFYRKSRIDRKYN